MRMFAFLAVLPLAMSPLAACSGHDGDASPGVKGSGIGTTRTFAASGFTAVDLRGADDIDVRVGSGFSVRAEGPADQLDKLKIERDGDVLKVGRINSTGFNWSGGHKGVKIYVTMPRITEGSVAGSGNLTIDRIEGEEFEGDLAGSGNLTVATIAVQRARFDIAGSGNAKVAGSATKVSFDIAGSGDVDAAGLKAEGASVSIAGSGNVTAQVNGPAKVDLMGSGDVDLGRNARCTTTKMGSGEVRCGA